MLQADRYWARFCEVLGITEAATDERFADHARAHGQRRRRASRCSTRPSPRSPRAEWLRLLAAGGDFIVCVVNSVDDLPDDPQVQANDYVTTFEHPGLRAHAAWSACRCGSARRPGQIRLPAPEFGQHTEEILTELLGYSWDDVARLKDAEVI